MVSGKQLLAESLVVGVVFAIIFIIIHMIAMKINAETSMTHTNMALQAFIAAIVFHVGAEFTGWNQKFCDEYRP